MQNSINWFSIPARDFKRACKFYSTILGAEVNVVGFGQEQMGMLPNFERGNNGVGGHIVHAPKDVTGKGVMVYLNGGQDLQKILDRVEVAGGKIVLQKTTSPGGYMAIFLDSEGNKLAIHNP